MIFLIYHNANIFFFIFQLENVEKIRAGQSVEKNCPAPV